MYDSIRKFHEQFLQSLDILAKADFKKIEGRSFRNIYLAGMGGSSLAGDLINDLLQGTFELKLVRDYRLPRTAGPKDLVICASYSGNTEETLATFKNALSKGCGLVVLAHGGQIRELALQHQVPFVIIPEAIQPRQAIGNFFATILGLLEQIGEISGQRQSLVSLTQFLESKQESSDEKGRVLAKQLSGHLPIIYGPSELYGACRVWKIKMNENAKRPSFFNVFPELNHNEMVGWTPGETPPFDFKPAIIYLLSEGMHPRVKKRMEVMESLLKSRIPFHHVNLGGEDLLEDMFEAILVADYTTYYLATDAGIDPVPVEMVEEFKKKL